MKEVTLQTFKDKLNIFYSEDNGKKETEVAVEKFSKFAIAQNKENNPFFLGELLSTIKGKQISLDELKNPNSSVVKEVIMYATKQAINLKQRMESNNKTENNKAENIIEKTYEEKLKERQKVDKTIEKYGGFKEFLEKATEVEINEYIEVRKEQKIINEETEALIIAIRNPQSLTENQNEILKNSELGKKLGYNYETREFEDEEMAKSFLVQWEKFSKEVIAFREDNPDKSDKEIIEILKDKPRFDMIFQMEYQDNIIEHMILVQKETENEKILESLEESDFGEIFDNLDNSNDIESLKKSDFGTMFNDPDNIKDIIENVVRKQFEKVIDPATMGNQASKNSNGLNLEEIVTEETSDYKVPTIEVQEKKGLAKWFDNLKKSRNPFARLITGSMWKKQDNLLNEANIQKYEDKPGTGRFDVTDVGIIPANKGVRNLFIQIGEKIMNLFGNKKVEKTENVLNPLNPNVNEFDKRYLVQENQLNGGQGPKKVIVPNKVKVKGDDGFTK